MIFNLHKHWKEILGHKKKKLRSTAYSFTFVPPHSCLSPHPHLWTAMCVCSVCWSPCFWTVVAWLWSAASWELLMACTRSPSWQQRWELGAKLLESFGHTLHIWLWIFFKCHLSFCLGAGIYLYTFANYTSQHAFALYSCSTQDRLRIIWAVIKSEKYLNFHVIT